MGVGEQRFIFNVQQAVVDMSVSSIIDATGRHAHSVIRDAGLIHEQLIVVLQDTGSFKVRGALNKLLCMSSATRAAGVVAASSGNHGLGLAVTPGDLTEGFALDPSGFDLDVTFGSATVQALPEAGSALLLALAGVARLARRRA